MKIFTAIFVLFSAGLGLCSEDDSLIEQLVVFGEISAIGNMDGALCSCPCEKIVELVDQNGLSIFICTGPDPKTRHFGFNLTTAIYSQKREMEIIPINSPIEQDLLRKMYIFLYSHFTLTEVDRWYADFASDYSTSEEQKARFLTKIIAGRDKGERSHDWLTINFTKEEQDRIINTAFGELQNENEKYAFRLICWSLGGSLFSRAGTSGIWECQVE